MPTILITGANRGIGQALATSYQAAGWKVYAARRYGGAVVPEGTHPVRLDVGDEHSIKALKDQLGDEPIDVLWNNAGVFLDKGKDLAKLPDEDWLESFRVNCVAPIRLAEMLIDNVAASDRRVMAFTSTKMASLARYGQGSIAYRSSKTALNMAVRCLSHDVAPRGISCIMLHPGWVKTDMGGEAADIDVETSVSGMRKTVDQAGPGQQADYNGRFFDYDGSAIDW
ncbi:SDR family oxidoreductase [Aestuariispira insulae]|uniref:NAD(P)-dependent dehydrogenase (Short-subunit alcohol dehydrogenase family) n=1 Tax=Aestuariispira insulae TaxID=1461337 RepID=A0A3D9HSR1_9PROT|nr:SDR family oxidoreductase [Aestuariispira insulae]RED52543.1 NAD(P)-dependent dehydrogenase (short-subunit alcohol dehydrogenase family) [Aestuariispira insulae]